MHVLRADQPGVRQRHQDLQVDQRLRHHHHRRHQTGHASGTYSHWNGYKIDTPVTTCTTNYITSHYTYSGVRGDGATLYTAPSGNVYAKEGNHWDITYYVCGC